MGVRRPTFGQARFRRAAATSTSASGTVTNVASADGSVVITNPTTTPDLSVRVVSAATPAALAALNVNAAGSTIKTGTPAIVAAMRLNGGAGIYYLEAAVSVAPDSFWVIATADDVARQWVHAAIVEQGLFSVYSQEIDLTVVQTITLVPPLTGFKMYLAQPIGIGLTVRNGTVTAGPTAQAGTDAGISNMDSSTVQAAWATAALNTRSLMVTAAAANDNLDLAANGVQFKITVGSTLGTATQHKGRLNFLASLAKF